MSRYTEKAFSNDVNLANASLLMSSSNYFFRFMPRNGYCGVDVHWVNEKGDNKHVGQTEVGTPRECDAYVQANKASYANKMHNDLKPTALMAHGLLKQVIDLTKTFDKLPEAHQNIISHWQELTGFKLASGTPRENSVAFLGSIKAIDDALIKSIKAQHERANTERDSGCSM